MTARKLQPDRALPSAPPALVVVEGSNQKPQTTALIVLAIAIAVTAAWSPILWPTFVWLVEVF